MTVDRAYWLRRVESRVERFAEQRDPDIVLADAALTEADQLLELAGPEPDVESAIAVGWLHWYRAGVVTEEHSRSEVEAAVTLFAPVFEVLPDYVPATLRDLLTEPDDLDDGAAALRHYLETRAAASLDRAVELLRVRAENEADPRVSAHRANLSVALREAFLAKGDPATLEEAVAWGRRGVADEPVSGAGRSVLAAAYLTRFDHAGASFDLDEAITQFDAAVADPADPAATNAVVLANRAAALLTRYENRSRPEDLDAATDSARRAVAAATDDEECSVAGSVLGQALRNRFEATGDRAALDEAVTAGRQAVELGRATGLEICDALSNLAAALAARHDADGTRGDLDEAITAAGEAARTADRENRATYLSNLGDLLHTRFEHTRDRRDLDDALDRAETAVAITPATSPRLASYLATRALLLHARHGLTGSTVDLDEAVTTARQAVDLLGAGQVDRFRVYSMLGTALETRYAVTGARADLDDAITAAEAAALGGGANRAAHLDNLASALRTRFTAAADPADLDRAAEVGEQAVRAAPNAADRARYASNLSAVLASRFEYHGRQADLDAAVEAARGGANLAAVLHTRFELLGELGDLDEAVTAARRALDAAPEGPATHLSTLCAVLLARYDALGEPADLDEAVTAARAAIDHTPPGAPGLAGRWSNLGDALLKQALGTEPPDFGAAVEACRTAVSACRPGAPEHGTLCANLAGVLIEDFLAHRDPSVIAEAVDVARTAVQKTPPGTPDSALFLTHLGIALAESGATADALSCLDEAARVAAAAPVVRLHAARWHGSYAAEAGMGEQAQAGYAAAVGLLGRASWHGLARRSRERHLAAVQGLASGAGAWSLHNGRPERAVELLELGRSVLWTQALDSPTDLADLAEVAPRLAERLLAVGRELDRGRQT